MSLSSLVIRILGYCHEQIVFVRRKRWDWSKAAWGIFTGFVFTLMVSMVSDIARSMFFENSGFWSALKLSVSFNTVVWWNWGLPGIFSMTVFFLIVLGLGWGEVILRDEVDAPNQGIKDSGRNAILVAAGGLAAVLIFSLGIGAPCYLGLGMNATNQSCSGGTPAALFSGLKLGLGYGILLALSFGLIFGGFAWLRHYLVRSYLYLQHQRIPWQLGKFLQYASKIRLLRQVGGGFEFIDQELQAHFDRL
jgi:hypothetical protein